MSNKKSLHCFSVNILMPILVTICGGFIVNYLWALKEDPSLKSIIFITISIILFGLVLYICWRMYTFLKNRQAGIFLKAKFKEFFKLLLDEESIQLSNGNKFNCYDHFDNYNKTTELLKETMCLNQGLIVDYNYTGARLHQELKKEFQSLNANTLKIKKKELEETLLRKLEESIKDNQILLSKYFKDRSTFLPRIIIKAIDNQDHIRDAYRENSEYSSNCKIHENSGFDYVYKNGTFFLCNDIPKAVEQDDYVNPRLNNSKVKSYLQDQSNVKWTDCWSKNKKGSKQYEASSNSCYKSTMIIPMTLLNNSGISNETKEKYQIPTPAKENGIGRAIYALLCFDHVEVDYFNEIQDEKIGYIFADLLSLFFIERLNYTKFSETIQKINGRIIEQGDE